MQSNLVVGILAHVDAGKTTLSEALLYESGALRRMGRVDHQDAFLDNDAMERKRGITIFSKQAVMTIGDSTMTLMDTPGHVDFSAETERVLGILDYAILVINAADGVQTHTLTLWQLLKRYRLPVFLFVNKMDLPASDAGRIMEELKRCFGDGFVPFGRETDKAFYEEAALCDEAALAEFLREGRIGDKTITALIKQRRVYPCFFGSALKTQGVAQLLEGISRYTAAPRYGDDFSARVFKITRDAQGARLTHMKITGGRLAVRDVLKGLDAQGSAWEEKINQIRVYSGSKYQAVDEALPGTVCAVTGLSAACPGLGLGAEPAGHNPQLTPVLSYRVILPEGTDPGIALRQLRELQEEDPQLSLHWTEQTREIRLQLMGEVQLEVIGARIYERFGLAVSFDAGQVVYRETILSPVIGVGHFEPLRHYAEVHLLLEPLARGSGLMFESICLDEVLPRSWQRLALSHLEEGNLRGVLTGSPLTDVKVSLLCGRAHNKHTQGGDFREAALRALRQGLMKAKSQLLEPWYSIRLELPSAAVGRAMYDLQRKGEGIVLEENDGDKALVTGRAPVSFVRGYAADFREYTHGAGRLSFSFSGFAPCPDQDKAVASFGYDPERDADHPADSVFCSQGAGEIVKWYQAENFMHLDRDSYPPQYSKNNRGSSSASGANAYQVTPEEMQAIFERTYGKVRESGFEPVKKRPKQAEDEPQGPRAPAYEKPDYLLVDGYNIIHAWEELSDMVNVDSMDAARQALMNRLSSFKGMDEREIILVFDAYRVQGEAQRITRFHNINVVYTREAETADEYIEKVSYEIGKRHRITVATGDSVIQLIALGHGALRISPDMLLEEVERCEKQMKTVLDRNNSPMKGRIVFPEGFKPPE